MKRIIISLCAALGILGGWQAQAAQTAGTHPYDNLVKFMNDPKNFTKDMRPAWESAIGLYNKILQPGVQGVKPVVDEIYQRSYHSKTAKERALYRNMAGLLTRPMSDEEGHKILDLYKAQVRKYYTPKAPGNTLLGLKAQTARQQITKTLPGHAAILNYRQKLAAQAQQAAAAHRQKTAAKKKK